MHSMRCKKARRAAAQRRKIWKRMQIKKNHFAEILRVCEFIDTKPYQLDRRQTVIILTFELSLREY